jgi:hypothetical protein
MAWTNPRTWTDGELVTKAIMDVHVRDNLNAIGARQHIRKTADQSVTSNTVLVNDTHLFFSIAASEVWVVEVRLYYTGATTGDIKMAWAVPAGATGRHSALGQNTSITAFDHVYNATLTTAIPLGALTSGESANHYATIVNAGTAGTVQWQWAQQASDATATIVLTNSILIAERVAGALLGLLAVTSGALLTPYRYGLWMARRAHISMNGGVDGGKRVNVHCPAGNCPSI